MVHTGAGVSIASTASTRERTDQIAGDLHSREHGPERGRSVFRAWRADMGNRRTRSPQCASISWYAARAAGRCRRCGCRSFRAAARAVLPLIRFVPRALRESVPILVEPMVRPNPRGAGVRATERPFLVI